MKTSSFTKLLPTPFTAWLAGASLIAVVSAATVWRAAAGGVNQPPQVFIVSPGDGQSFTAGDDVPVLASAMAFDGFVTHVDFYVDGMLRFADPTLQYGFTLGGITAGPHMLWAVAHDNNGLMGTSSVVNVFANFPPGEVPLVPNGSVWRYRDTGADLGTEWRDPFFDDHLWAAGAGELGYGDDAEDRPETTVVNSGHITTYFRHTFFVQDPGLFNDLVVRLKRDDGGIVYLNGLEVFRSNMPTGAVTRTTLALGAAPDDGTIFFSANANPAMLVAGPNVIAVEVHQNVANSADLSFDLMLTGLPGLRPPDCNRNGQDDLADIAEGTSFDANYDHIPDECQASVALQQLSYVDEQGNFVQRFSQHGAVTVRAHQPPPGQVAFFNLVVDNRWVVQNLPLQPVSCAGFYHDYTVQFGLVNSIGAPSPPVGLCWTIHPNPSAAPPAMPPMSAPVTEIRVRPSTTSGLTEDAPLAFIPGLPTDFLNPTATTTDMKVSRTGVPTVDEPVNHCGPGAGARCLAWMSKEYCLGLTNAQALMNKLKNASHMMTTTSNGTFYSKLAPALLSCLASNGATGFTAQLCRTNSPSDLVTALKGGKDVIMLIGWYGPHYTTNMGMVVSNYVRLGGHIVAATGATMGTNGETSIDFQDDALGEDDQGDDTPDGGATKTTQVQTNATGGWELTSIDGRFEGFVKVCPPLSTVISSMLKRIVGNITTGVEGVRPRLLRYSSGAVPTPEELNQLIPWTWDAREIAGHIFTTVQEEGFPLFSILLADLNVTWCDQLQLDMGEYTRSFGGSGSGPQMVQLAMQSENALGLINNCLLNPADCGGVSQPTINITRTGPLTAMLTWDGLATLQLATNISGPWDDQLSAASGQPITLGQAQRFYRLVNTNQGCLFGVKSIISGQCNVGNFICVRPCLPGGVCPQPLFENGQWQIIIVDANNVETCRVEVSPTVPCASCDVPGFVVTPAVWVDPLAGKIRLK